MTVDAGGLKSLEGSLADVVGGEKDCLHCTKPYENMERERNECGKVDIIKRAMARTAIVGISELHWNGNFRSGGEYAVCFLWK